MNRNFIDEQTGFEQGEKFVDAADVRSYFTVACMDSMFGPHCECEQSDLDEMAEMVIANHWHMT